MIRNLYLRRPLAPRPHASANNYLWNLKQQVPQVESLLRVALSNLLNGHPLHAPHHPRKLSHFVVFYTVILTYCKNIYSVS